MLGSTALTGRSVSLENLIGDDPWQPALSEAGAHLHLYGKGSARAGRKMGHVTCVAATAAEAIALAREVGAVLGLAV